MSPSVEPFNEAKYKALMDGLECSEIKLSEALGANGDSRWDSEYFSKNYLHINEILKQKNNIPFSKYCKSIKKGIFDLSPILYKTQGIPLIRTSEIKKPTIDFRTTTFIDKRTNAENNKTVLLPNDIVFTKIGAYIGDVAILPSTYPQYNFSQNVAGASLKVHTEGPYLLAFFLSKFGKNQILRSAMLSGQGKLELTDIRNYKIPTLNTDFINLIADIFNIIRQKDRQSAEKYEYAINILNSFLDLDFTNIIKSHTKKLLSNSFGISGRLDAEYYQPKYDILFDRLSEFTTFQLSGKNGLVDIKKSIEPGSDYYQEEGIPFIRVSDIDKFEIGAPNIKLPQDIVENAECLYPQKNTILFSKDGSVGIAHKVQEDMKAITSSALLHLTIKNTDVILPDYLTLVLNSPIVQLQAERDMNGAIIQHWKPSDIEKVVIPVLDMDVQKEISEKVQESFKLRKESKRMLECAVKAVEMAIESDENTAIRWLEMQL